MTTKTAGRHRLPVRPRTPLTTIGEAVSTSASTMGRRSAVIAASSGLMVTMGLPAAGASPLMQPTADPGAGSTSAAPVADDTTVTAPTQTQVNLALSSLTSVDAAQYQHDQQVAAAEKTAAGRVMVKQQSVPPDPSSAASGAAASSPDTTTAAASGVASAAPGSAAVDLARRYIGIPYRYGGTTPAGFDCSGFVKYVYAQLGVDLPRTAAQQAQAGTRISADDAQPGDIVSFYGSGGVYHNGIYTGNGMMINSPRTGKTLQEQPIWSSAVVFTRVSS